MELTTPLLGAAIGAGVGYMRKKKDVLSGMMWGAGIGLFVTLSGGVGVSVGSINVRVGGGSEPDVRSAQTMLNKLGYATPVDGVLGPVTADALHRVQMFFGLQQADGSLTAETMSTLHRLTNT